MIQFIEGFPKETKQVIKKYLFAMETRDAEVFLEDLFQTIIGICKKHNVAILATETQVSKEDHKRS